MTTDRPRLIEVAFPLKQTSIDSVHEKSVRHGHISTLHIWPARRPLAACRAALIATLLPDPGNAEERKEILERLGGHVVEVVRKKKLPSGRVEERLVEETVGGILHWGRESGPDLDWFRKKIRESYGGRAPRVLDPFAGGGAIPLEAMRLGCEVTASDINPVAWLILKCTLEYPQRLAVQTRPLPQFALDSPGFMEGFLKSHDKPASTKRGRAKGLTPQMKLMDAPEADLAWHVRAWGWWVLQRARADLERFYPVIDGKPAVAYLWARTVTCKHCRATVPLLKTRWLCKKPNKRVLLTMEPNPDRTGVTFGVQQDVPQGEGGPAQRRDQDKLLGAGTMSRSGASCRCCGAIMTRDDLRIEGQNGRLRSSMTAVVAEGLKGKEYRPPASEEGDAADDAKPELREVFAAIPHGLPNEPFPEGASRVGGGSSFTPGLYGFTHWYDIFTSRQLLALGTFVKHTRAVCEAMNAEGYTEERIEAIQSYLYASLGRLADRNAELCTWQVGAEKIGHVFTRFALPMTWDFVEVMPWADSSGGYLQAVQWVAGAVEHASQATAASFAPVVLRASAKCTADARYDVVMTDPPYYDAISYSDLMDFFYIWARRTLCDLSPGVDDAFEAPLGPKWDSKKNDGELIDEASRFGGDSEKSKAAYEDGMFHAFQACDRALKTEGRMVVVFAHKQPDAWETLVSAMIRAGFVVDGSWPIETERKARTRSLSSAALSSSVWLVCKKRPEAARPGWDNRVLEEMRERIAVRLRDFWDAGIRGPDFVWAATGPALEAYSKHPVVKKANEPGALMTVSEFLQQARRMVVDFIVGRVLSEYGADGEVSGLDEVTTYYLLHRHDFGLGDAPVGACILYAVSCGLSDTALADRYEILSRSGGLAEEEAEAEADEPAADDDEDAAEAGGGSKVRLRPWNQRRRKGLGYDAPAGRPVPLIDQAHRLMQLWRAADVSEVDDYLDARGLRHNALFQQLLQALIELAPPATEERALLESISNHVAARGAAAPVGRLL